MPMIEAFRVFTEAVLGSSATHASLGNFSMAMLAGLMAADVWNRFVLVRRATSVLLCAGACAAIIEPTTGEWALNLLFQAHHASLATGFLLASPLRAMWTQALGSWR